MSWSLNVGVVEAAFDVTLSARYRRFLTRREWRKVNGWYAVLPHYAVPLAVRFDGALLGSFFRDCDEDYSLYEAGDEELPRRCARQHRQHRPPDVLPDSSPRAR